MENLGALFLESREGRPSQNELIFKKVSPRSAAGHRPMPNATPVERNPAREPPADLGDIFLKINSFWQGRPSRDSRNRAPRFSINSRGASINSRRVSINSFLGRVRYKSDWSRGFLRPENFPLVQLIVFAPPPLFKTLGFH